MSLFNSIILFKNGSRPRVPCPLVPTARGMESLRPEHATSSPSQLVPRWNMLLNDTIEVGDSSVVMKFLGVKKSVCEAVRLLIKSSDQNNLLGEYYLTFE